MAHKNITELHKDKRSRILKYHQILSVLGEKTHTKSIFFSIIQCKRIHTLPW